MIEFSRKRQENKLVATQEEELRKLTEEEIELEEKLQQLFELDRALQEKSLHLANLQEDKELLEKGLKSLLQTIEWEPDPLQQRHLQAKKQSLENELTLLRKRLADASKVRDVTSFYSFLVLKFKVIICSYKRFSYFWFCYFFRIWKKQQPRTQKWRTK